MPTIEKRAWLLNRRKLLIGGFFVFLAVGYLIYTLYTGFNIGTYYLTVSELKNNGQLLDQEVRVNGKVVPGSIQWDSEGAITRFAIADAQDSLYVVYHGVVPDTFKPGADVTVKGRFNADDVLEANQLLAKCSSKYVPLIGD